MNRALLISMLAGCAGAPSSEPTPEPGNDPVPTVPEDPPPSDYIYEEGELPEPTASLDEIEEALQDALDVAMTIHAAPVQAAYDAAMAGSTFACPYVYATPDGSYWYDSCTASDGSEFDGYVFAYEASDQFDPSSGMFFDSWYAFGGATVENARGDTLELAGGAVSIKGTGNSGGVEVLAFQTDVGGTFQWDGPEADGTWLASGIDPDLVSYVTSVPAIDEVSVFLSGGFGGFADGWAVAFDENVVGHPVLGLPCAEELSGTVGVRATDGTWYDVQFQGSDGTDPEYDGARCDGCGDVYYQGEPMGELCVDASTMLAMAVRPW
jgi:hypothetical protein